MSDIEFKPQASVQVVFGLLEKYIQAQQAGFIAQQRRQWLPERNIDYITWKELSPLKFKGVIGSGAGKALKGCGVEISGNIEKDTIKISVDLPDFIVIIGFFIWLFIVWLSATVGSNAAGGLIIIFLFTPVGGAFFLLAIISILSTRAAMKKYLELLRGELLSITDWSST